MPAAQVREALAVRLPRAERAEREAPKALSAGQYERLLREAKARIADEPLAGTRDLATVLALGDAGLRCEELARLERRDVLPARKGARPRALDVRQGKATAAASSSAPPPPGRSCAGIANAPPPSAPPPTTRRVHHARHPSPRRHLQPCGWPLRPRHPGRPAQASRGRGRAARRAAPPACAAPHLRPLLRAGATIADVTEFLGLASVKTTSIYLASGEDRQEHVVRLRERGRTTLDDDRYPP